MLASCLAAVLVAFCLDTFVGQAKAARAALLDRSALCADLVACARCCTDTYIG